MDALKSEAVPTAKLATMAAPYNPRTISDHDLEALRRSMAAFGVVEPIVCNRTTNRVVGGHQRVKAAEAEGIDVLPVVWVELDENGEKQLNLALNRISGQWDDEALRAVLVSLAAEDVDLDLTGFDSGELDHLLRDLEAGGTNDADSVPHPPDVAATQRGDLITLGDHRLMCADAGVGDDVSRLTGGEPVQLVNTDPPYNVNVEPRSNNAIAAAGKKRMHHQSLDLARFPEKKATPTGKMRARDRVLENDFVSTEEFDRLLRAWFSNAAFALEPGRAFYIWGGYANLFNYPRAFACVDDLYFSQTIIWHKQWPVLTRKDFMGDHEWCFYGWKKGAAHYFNPRIHNATDVWSVKKVAPPSMVHLTEKPVELAERAMEYSSRRGDRVLDLFGGSGSTLIAAERMERRAFLMELDPAYCDVIVTRWQEFTGKHAEGWRGNS